MAPASRQKKSKSQELERIRQNQQRSRQRKRAYIAELEQKVNQLTEQVQHDRTAAAENGHETSVHATQLLKHENDARRDLLLAMGVTASAQEQFIRAAARRLENGASIDLEHRSGSSGSGSEEVNAQTVNQDTSTPFVNLGTSAGWDLWSDAEWTTSALAYHTDFSHGPSPSQENLTLHSISDPPLESLSAGPHLVASHFGTSPAGSLASMPLSTISGVLTTLPDRSDSTLQSAVQTRHTASESTFTLPSVSDCQDTGPLLSLTTPQSTQNPHAQVALLDDDPGFGTAALFNSTEPGLLLPSDSTCLRNAVIHTPAQASNGKTACSIAYSMIFQHNVRGYSTAELEKRLRVGYRKGKADGEGCWIVNKVLFTVLADIS